MTDEAEWNLVGELIRLPQVIVSAANAREPHRLTGYVFDIAGLFNQFYQRKDQRIISDDRETTIARLNLCLMTRHVLRVVLDLIGVDAPEVLEVKV